MLKFKCLADETNGMLTIGGKPIGKVTSFSLTIRATEKENLPGGVSRIVRAEVVGPVVINPDYFRGRIVE